MTEEIWKDIVGFENYYQVSNMGRIRSKDKIESRMNMGKIRDHLIKGKVMKFDKHISKLTNIKKEYQWKHVKI